MIFVIIIQTNRTYISLPMTLYNHRTVEYLHCSQNQSLYSVGALVNFEENENVNV